MRDAMSAGRVRLPMMRRALVLALGVALLSLGGAAQAVGDLGPAPAPPSDPWLAAAPDPLALQAALTTHGAKLPVELHERLEHVLDDGTLRVMVVTTHRDAAVERFVADHTTSLHWYGDAPRFMATVTQAELLALLTSPLTTFVEPDYPVVLNMATSTVDVQARSLASAGTGVWSFDPAIGTHGALVSDTAGLSVDQATGKGVAVAVNDGGIDATHKDFSGEGCVPEPYQPCSSRILEQVLIDQVVGGVEGDADQPTTDLASGHGTHVSGTVAGNGFYSRDGEDDVAVYGADGLSFGVAPQASIVSVKNGEAQSAALGTAGLQWTLDNAERLGIKVSTNSWGCLGGCSYNPGSATSAAIKDLYDAGVVVLFAAGNDAGGPDGASFSGYAQSPYTLAVAAYNDVNDQLASFSSRGRGDAPLPDPSRWDPDVEAGEAGQGSYRRPDIGAPGVTIWSARNLTGGAAAGFPRIWAADVIGGENRGIRPYGAMSGTSMATPHVAGAAALLYAACPAAAPLDVMRAMLVTASDRVTKTGSTSVAAEPFEIGYGALNVRPAVDWLLGREVCGGNPENLLPDAVIDAPLQARPNEAVTLDGSGSTDFDGAVVEHRWDFGDGTTATGATVEHTWADERTYTVTLQVTDDDGGTGVATATIEVTSAAAGDGVTILDPGEGATVQPGTIGVSGVVRRPSGGGGTLHLVGDGSSGNGVVSGAAGLSELDPTLSHFALSSTDPGEPTSFTTVGPWNVESWSNPFLPTFSGDEQVTLTGNPVTFSIDVEYLAPAQAALVCPITAQLYASGAAISDAIDVDAQPTLSTQTLTFTFAPSPGTYAGLGVQVGPAYLDCGEPAVFRWGSADHPGSITLDPADTLVRTPGPETERVEVALDGATVADAPVDTSAGDDEFAVSVEVTDVGEHELVATWYGTYGEVIATDTNTFTVADANLAPSAVIEGPATADLDVEVAFDGSGSTDPDGDELSYLWDFGDGSPLASSASVTHVYETTGTYTVRLVVGDGRGGSDVATHEVTVSAGEDPPAKGTKRIFAELDTADCGSDWHFIVTGIAAPQAPSSMLATWDAGTSSVALSAARSTVAHYRTTQHLDGSLAEAWIDVPKSHRGDFFLALAPC